MDYFHIRHKWSIPWEGVLHNDLWPWPISSRSFSHDFAIKLLKYGTSYCVRSIAHAVLGGFFPYSAQMITSIRGCVACNALWPWPTSSKSFIYEFAIKVLKYDTFCSVRSAAYTILDGFFWHLAKMITSMRWCFLHNDLSPHDISSRSFSHDFAIKLLTYDTSCHVRSTGCTDLDEFSPYFGTNDH